MKLIDQMKNIDQHYMMLVQQYHALGEEIARLTAYGCINAQEYWKNEKYLYLVYPMRGGVRKKKYVGCHPERIKEAQAKLDNYARRLEVIQRQEKVAAWLEEIETAVSRLVQSCGRLDLVAIHGDNHGVSSSDICLQ